MAEDLNPSTDRGRKSEKCENNTMETTTYGLGDVTFTYWHAAGLIISLITYFADIGIDFVVAVQYCREELYGYCFAVLCLVLLPAIFIQIFSIRWHQMDEVMSNFHWSIHLLLLGIPHRYFVVLSLGIEAMKTGAAIDYQRYLQQQSDVCMLRLFESFTESAPQLVFHLYVMITASQWDSFKSTWTGMSAVAALVSLGWGIASYGSALRMVREDKGKLSWTGMILQTIWRFGMLSARITALVLLTLALHQWVVIVLFVHWIGMTAWVIWQNTDFCTNVWEERLYNAIVGVIYCFCFFNLKEGQSRNRASAFYSIIIIENFAAIAVYFLFSQHSEAMTVWFSLGGLAIVVSGTIIGLISMILYYRFFHPAGPIKPPGICLNYNEKSDEPNASKTPDFVIQDVTYDQHFNNTTPKRKPVQYSRSFKASCPPPNRCSPDKLPQRASPESIGQTSPVHDKMDSAYGTDSNRTASRNTASPTQHDRSGSAGDRSASSLAYNNETYMSIDEQPEDVNGSYVAIEQRPVNVSATSKKSTSTYMSMHPPSENHEALNMSQDSQMSSDSRVTVIDRSENRMPERLLKRSPIVKDVTSSFAQISSTSNVVEHHKQNFIESLSESQLPATSTPNGSQHVSLGDGLTAPLTIIIPNISHQAIWKSNQSLHTPSLSEKTISLDILNPNLEGMENLSAHDYENMALVNINRNGAGITHWRTYSDMANSKHDDSVAYERTNNNADYSNYPSLQYYDIHPLSKEMKDQLYRSFTPVSTAATCDSVASSDTYEPIEVMSDIANNDLTVPVPVTLIHHDGTKLITKRITSMENLKEVLHRHEKVPMDDPQDRGDLYLLAPMRLLTPIIEEPEPQDTNSTKRSEMTYEEVNRSLMTIISEALSHRSTLPDQNRNPPDGRLANSIDSATSTLVHTIEEIRNSSLCNLYNTSFGESLQNVSAENSQAVPQVPPRNTSQINKSSSSLTKSTIDVPLGSASSKTPKLPPKPPAPTPPRESPVMSIRSNTLVPSPVSRGKTDPNYKTVKLSSTRNIGSRKNILELAGSTNNILNTPKKHLTATLSPMPEETTPRIPLKPNNSILTPQQQLSSSTEYTPTPPLGDRVYFVRNTALNRPRRKFSILRDRFESQDDQVVPKMSQSNSELHAIAKRDDVIRPDEKYDLNRGGWTTTSMILGPRNVPHRRSMSILDSTASSSTMTDFSSIAASEARFMSEKENQTPPLLRPKPIHPKPKSSPIRRGGILSPHTRTYRPNETLSPQSKIFNLKSHA